MFVAAPMPLCGSTRVARLGNTSGALPSIPDPLRSIRIPGGSGRKKCSLPSWGITRIGIRFTAYEELKGAADQSTG